VVRNTVFPFSFRPSRTSHTSRRAPGSSPVVGSSRNTTSGSFTSANRDSEALLQAPGKVLVLLPGLVLEVHEVNQPVDIGFPAAKSLE